MLMFTWEMELGNKKKFEKSFVPDKAMGKGLTWPVSMVTISLRRRNEALIDDQRLLQLPSEKINFSDAPEDRQLITSWCNLAGD
jgi:hypothetical protein